MEAGVHDDPRDQEARCPGEEALLGQLPGPAILRLINALDPGVNICQIINHFIQLSLMSSVNTSHNINPCLNCGEPDVHEPGREGGEQGETDEAVEGDEAPDGAQHQADDLPRPVDHVHVTLLIVAVTDILCLVFVSDKYHIMYYEVSIYTILAITLKKEFLF